MTKTVGYISKQKAEFWKGLEQNDYCIMANQLGGSPLNYSKEMICEQCNKLMALLCQYSVPIKETLHTLYCFACKGHCGEVVLIRKIHKKSNQTLTALYDGLEDYCVEKTSCRESKNNMKMYQRYELLEDIEDLEFENYTLDSMGLLMYQDDFPSTVIRVNSTIFLTDQIPIEPRHCTCGSKRIIISQILPNSLFYLKRKEDINSLDFGTVILCICEQYCGQIGDEIKERAIRLQFKDPPKNDDGIYDYSYLLKNRKEE